MLSQPHISTKFPSHVAKKKPLPKPTPVPKMKRMARVLWSFTGRTERELSVREYVKKTHDISFSSINNILSFERDEYVSFVIIQRWRSGNCGRTRGMGAGSVSFLKISWLDTIQLCYLPLLRTQFNPILHFWELIVQKKRKWFSYILFNHSKSVVFVQKPCKKNFKLSQYHRSPQKWGFSFFYLLHRRKLNIWTKDWNVWYSWFQNNNWNPIRLLCKFLCWSSRKEKYTSRLQPLWTLCCVVSEVVSVNKPEREW